MATAQECVTRALRRLQAIDINSQPSASEMSHGLAVLGELVNGWSMSLPEIAIQSMDASFDSGDTTITVDDTTLLAVGLNVSGTGIPTGAYIVSICATDKVHFDISVDTTASGTDTSLSFTPIPFPVKHEGGVIALLAVRLAEDMGLPVLPQLKEDSIEGWRGLLADYMKLKVSVFDREIAMPAGRWDINTDIVN